MTDFESSVIQLLSQILSSIDELGNQIRSNQSNLFRSDQIRSDQISNSRSTSLDNWLDQFKKALDTYGISYENMNLRSVEQGAMYFLQNHTKITSKKSYLAKIMKACLAGPNSVSDLPPEVPRNSRKPAEISDDTSILGIPRDQVEAKINLLDQKAWTLLKPYLDPTYKSFFTTYDQVMASSLKRNLFAALCIKHGII